MNDFATMFLKSKVEFIKKSRVVFDDKKDKSDIEINELIDAKVSLIESLYDTESQSYDILSNMLHTMHNRINVIRDNLKSFRSRVDLESQSVMKRHDEVYSIMRLYNKSEETQKSCLHLIDVLSSKNIELRILEKKLMEKVKIFDSIFDYADQEVFDNLCKILK